MLTLKELSKNVSYLLVSHSVHGSVTLQILPINIYRKSVSIIKTYPIDDIDFLYFRTHTYRSLFDKCPSQGVAVESER